MIKIQYRNGISKIRQNNEINWSDLVECYNEDTISKIFYQNSPEEDWSLVNIYDVFDFVLEQVHEFVGLPIYETPEPNSFIIVANPDMDIVEMFDYLVIDNGENIEDEEKYA